MNNTNLHAEIKPFQKQFGHKLLAIVCIISILLSFLSGCTASTSDKILLRIGVTGVSDIEKCETFLENCFEHIDFKFFELGTGDNDSFSNVCSNIERMFSENKLDMIIGIPEDYVRSLPNNLFLNLYNIIDIDNMISPIKGHLTKTPNEMRYVTHSLYCTRLFIANTDLLNTLNVEIPASFESIPDLIRYAYLVQESIEEASLKDTYAISLGSPIDEFLFDDIANLLLPYGYPRTEEGQQSRFTDTLYTTQYEEIYNCALATSYRRKDIGHQYTLDFYFSTGHVALKCASAYELKMFNYSNSNMPHNPYIDNFTYTVIPLTETLNSQSTVNAISANTRNQTMCLEVINFLLSEKYANSVLDGSSPFLNDAYSFPCVFNDEIEERIKLIYRIESLESYTDYTNFSFAKDSTIHWSVIQQEQKIFQDAFNDNTEGNIHKILENLKNING